MFKHLKGKQFTRQTIYNISYKLKKIKTVTHALKSLKNTLAALRFFFLTTTRTKSHPISSFPICKRLAKRIPFHNRTKSGPYSCSRSSGPFRPWQGAPWRQASP